MKRITLVSLLSVLGLAACGGTSEVPRPDTPAPQIVDNSDDFGGRAADCSAEAEFDIHWIEQWESGSGTGWFTNNDRCDECSTAMGDRSDVQREINCLKYQLNSANFTVPKDASGDPETDLVADNGYVCDNWDFVKTVNPDAYRIDPATLDPIDAKGVPVDLETGDRDPYVVDGKLTAKFQQEGYKTLIKKLADLHGYQDILESCKTLCEGSQMPSFYAKPPPSELIIGGARCGSTRALHIRTVQLREFGGNMGREFSQAKPFNAYQDTKHPYDGLAFWARKGPGGRTNLRAALATPDTTEKFDTVPDTVKIEPACLFETNMDTSQAKACDKFGSDVILSGDWKFYTLPFEEMRQAGYGVHADTFDISAILSLSLEYRTGSWDIWIDDVGFYRSRAQ